MDAHALLADEASVDAARAYLPWITGWGPVVALPLCAFAASAAGTTIATTIALDRRSLRPEVPWPERARAVFPARTSGRILLVLASMPCLVLLPLFSGVLARASYGLLAALVAAASIAGGQAARGRLERRIDARWSAGRSFVNMGAVVSMFMPHVLAAMLVVMAAGAFFLTDSLRGAVACSLAALIAALLAMRGSLLWARMAGLVRPAPARVTDVVARMASAMQLPVPAAYVLRWSMANAIALPLHRAVVFTEARSGC